MASYEEDRRELFDLLEAGLGSRGAGLLMAQLPPVGWTELATKTDVAVLQTDLAAVRSELKGDVAELRGEFAELRGELAAFRTEMRGEFAKIDARFEKVDAEFVRVRGESAHDRAALARSFQVTTYGSMIGLAGLVFAVATFAR